MNLKMHKCFLTFLVCLSICSIVGINVSLLCVLYSSSSDSSHVSHPYSLMTHDTLSHVSHVTSRHQASSQLYAGFDQYDSSLFSSQSSQRRDSALIYHGLGSLSPQTSSHNSSDDTSNNVMTRDELGTNFEGRDVKGMFDELQDMVDDKGGQGRADDSNEGQISTGLLNSTNISFILHYLYSTQLHFIFAVTLITIIIIFDCSHHHPFFSLAVCRDRVTSLSSLSCSLSLLSLLLSFSPFLCPPVLFARDYWTAMIPRSLTACRQGWQSFVAVASSKFFPDCSSFSFSFLYRLLTHPMFHICLHIRDCCAFFCSYFSSFFRIFSTSTFFPFLHSCHVSFFLFSFLYTFLCLVAPHLTFVPPPLF